MDLRPWNYWTRDGQPLRRDDARSRRALEQVLAQQQEPSRRAAPVDPPLGSDRHAGARGGRSRSAAAADAGRRPHRAHAGAHLSARRPPRRRHPRRTSSPRRPTRTTSRSAARRASTRSPTTRTTCTSSGWAHRRAGRRRSRSNRRASSPRAIPQRGARRPRRSSRASWSCRTGRWCASASGTRSSPSRGPRIETAVHPRHLALRAGAGAHGKRGQLDDAERELDELQAARRRIRRSTARRRSRPTPGTRSCGSRPRSSPARSPLKRGDCGSRDRCTSIARSATRTRWSTRSRPTGTCRRGRTSPPHCWRRSRRGSRDGVVGGPEAQP